MSGPVSGPVGMGPPLVAIAHGSRDLRSPAVVARLTRLVAVTRPDLRVETAYLDHCAPSTGQVLDRLVADGHREVVVLPLLLTTAYHAKVDLPGVLGQVRRRHPRLVVRYGRALGPHPLLVAAMERRLREAGIRPGDPSVGLVLASAGSSDPDARDGVARLARDWQATGWARVLPAFASAARPTAEEAVAALHRLGVARIAVASYFIAPGFLPDRVRADSGAADATSDPLGAAPELACLVLARYDEAREHPAALSA